MIVDLGGTLVVYLAGAFAFLSILGLSYLYRRIIYNPIHTRIYDYSFDEISCSQTELTEVSFPVTLELMNRVAMVDEATLQFLAPCSIQANISLTNPGYFEIKLIELNERTKLCIGVAHKTFDTNFIPGKVSNSVGVEISLRAAGHPFQFNDTIGLFYHPSQPLTIIHNGRVKGLLPLPTGTLVPTMYANGPAIVHVNFGQSRFVYESANQGYGLVPSRAILAQPPNYERECLPKYTRWSDPKLIPNR